ncbi:MAG: hypothetical protein ACRDLP_12350 [Solirubrobacteraceae bacterium]
MVTKRLAMMIGALASVVAVSACGAGEHARYSDNLGPGYVQLGALNYQIQISRQLNPLDAHEDKWYLQGFNTAQLALPAADEWFGISLQVFNWTHHGATPTSDFYITDTLGDRFTPLTNPSPNPYTYVASSIPAGGQLPNISSAAYAGWTQGEMLVFKVPYADLPDRPFVLHIVTPGHAAHQSRIELDV